MKHTVEPESLLEHRGFVRGIVHRLIPDEHQVDDIVQETWLTALRSPPRKAGSLRAWLARVGRNLAVSALRRQQRRRRRERAAARPERVAAAGDLVERLEHHSAVVDAVLALDEPLRETVLLRFYEELPPREIAALHGIPVATVRSRLRRAVARLRRHFDATYGDRATWCFALAPLAAVPVVPGGGTTVLSLGGPVMKTKLIYAALAVCALGTALVLWRAGGDEEDSIARGESDRVAPAPEPEPKDRAPRERTITVREVQPDRGEKTAPGAPEDEREKSERPPPPGPGLVTGSVKLEDGRLPIDVEVTLRNLTRGEDGRLVDPEPQLLKTVADGQFRFDDLPPGKYGVRVSHPDFSPHGFSFDVTDEQGAGPYDVILKSGGTILVRVLGAGNRPLADQVIKFTGGTGGGHVVSSGRTDVEGKLVLEHMAPGQYWIRKPVVDDDGREAYMQEATRTVTVEPGKTAEVVFEVACGLTGTVTGANGQPLAKAIVRLTPTDFGKEGYRSVQTRTDDDGVYEIRGFPPGEYSVAVQKLGKNAFVAEVGKITVRSGETLDHPVRIRPTVLKGRITRADTGAPLGRRDVQISAYHVEVEDGKVVRRLGHGAMAWADADGHYSFKGIQPGFYKIWIFPHVKGLRRTNRVVDFTSGGTLRGVDFVLEPSVLGKLRLEVLEPDGTPATGLSFSVVTGRRKTEKGESTSTVTLHAKGVGDGIYEFSLEAGEREVAIYRKGFHARVVATIAPDGTTELIATLKPLKPPESEDK